MRLFMMCGFIVPAIWMLRLAAGKHLLVVVETPKTRRKLLFKTKVNPHAAEELLRQAAERYRYEIG